MNKKTIKKLWVIEQYRKLDNTLDKVGTYNGSGLSLVTDWRKGKSGVVLHFPNIFTKRSDARFYLKILKSTSIKENPSLKNVTWKIRSFCYK